MTNKSMFAKERTTKEKYTSLRKAGYTPTQARKYRDYSTSRVRELVKKKRASNKKRSK